MARKRKYDRVKNNAICVSWNKKNPWSRLLRGARERAKAKGILCTLTKDDIVVPDRCPVLGIEICRSNVRAKENSPTIDRIDVRKGYVPGNIAVISLRANRIKNDASLDELKLITAWMEKALGGSNEPMGVGEYRTGNCETVFHEDSCRCCECKYNS